MSQIRVNEVVSENSFNAPAFPNGVVVTGVVTATSFIGDGSQLSGIDANYSPVAGIATYATTAGIATYATTAGIATYATTAGVATDAQGLTGTPDIAVRNVTGVAATFSGNVSATNELSVGGNVEVGNNVNLNDSTVDLYCQTTNGGSKTFQLFSDVGGTKVEKAFIDASGDASFAGVVTATSYEGDGSQLTGIIAGASKPIAYTILLG